MTFTHIETDATLDHLHIALHGKRFRSSNDRKGDFASRNEGKARRTERRNVRAGKRAFIEG
jgi:hypothetical protein